MSRAGSIAHKIERLASLDVEFGVSEGRLGVRQRRERRGWQQLENFILTVT